MSRVGGRRITENIKLLAAFVRAARNLIHMSQFEFADWVGISRITLVRLEKSTSPLSYGVLVAIITKLKKHGITSEAMTNILLGESEAIDKLDINVNWEKLKQLLESENK